MTYQQKQRTHRETLIYHSDMNINTGHWEETGTPNWGGDDYVRLDASELLTSLRTYQYGVLTFDAWCNDWTAAVMGFWNSQGDYVLFTLDNFESRKMTIADPPSDAVTLTDETWYHFIMTWCPQFVELKIYELDGTSVYSQKYRNPPSKRMNLYFEMTEDSQLNIGCVSVQGGDDSQFFLDPIDHVIMDQIPTGGGTYVARDIGWAIQLAALNQISRANGAIRPGITQYRFRIYIESNAALDILYSTRLRLCDGTGAIDPTGNITTTTNGAYECLLTPWYGLNGLPYAVKGRLIYNQAAAGNVWVHSWSVELQ